MAFAPEPPTGISQKIAALGAALRTDDILFFPIRHHSPACAWHVRKVIQREKPVAILIEGPQDATALIPFIVHAKTQTPFAMYTTFVDSDNRLNLPDEIRTMAGVARFAGYYPFCDYSPELVAIQAGKAIGAHLRFIDLTFPEKVLAGSLRESTSLLDETHLKRSAYLAALAKNAGCRDQDDLWDHLFEANFLKLDSLTFMQQVAAYCLMSRLDATAEALEADGTNAREWAMAAAIREERANRKGLILVVTGGFHTVALPELVKQPAKRSQPLKLASEDAQTVLMRFSFEQLDALNGYAAGMPSPNYYQRFWQRLQRQPDSALLDTANRILVEIGRRTREKEGTQPLSTADEIAALTQAERLARFRGHTSGPTREDLLDGIRGCFVKGAMDTEGQLLMAVVQVMLVGDQVGNVPPEAGVPPLVDDFRRQATALRLKINDTVTKSLSLDLYRKRSHRSTSRFLHCLKFLKVPFGAMTAGPDFVTGRSLDRLFETWDYRWLPQTESTLIERSLFGTTVAEAATNRLKQAIADLADEGKARSATEAVAMLIHACRMGLHAHTQQLLTLIARHINDDPAVLSLIEALKQLTLLWQSREPLEAHKLAEVPALALAAYRKACFLLPALVNCPPEQAFPTLAGINLLREFLASTNPEEFDPELFFLGLAELPAAPQVNAVMAGGAAGILFSAGKMELPAVLELVAGYLDSASGQTPEKIGFLQGFLKCCREAAWTIPELLQVLDQRLHTWPEADFLKILPELRLSFADLTPRETDRVAASVAQLHGKADLGHLHNRELSAADAQLAMHINRIVLESLRADGLL
ncbi:MAG: hypothetical protein K1Y36_03715 [Blastocatellia bacterium]|nr:hypothetical protein [Blastocatellia bacterium]